MGSGTGQVLNHSPVMGLGQADSRGLGGLGSSIPALGVARAPTQSSSCSSLSALGASIPSLWAPGHRFQSTPAFPSQ